MIPNSFDYHRATSVDEAIRLMAQHGMDAKLLAGGHSLLPAMKLRLNQPGVLVDIGRLAELRYIKKEGDSLVIGAGATHDDIANSEVARNTLSMLSEAANLIGDVQVRNKGTLGGSLAHADPAADWPAVMIAAHAHIELRGPNGSRTVAADDFFTGFYMTALAEDEIITAIRIPAPPKGTHSSYQKFMQPASRFAIVGCAASVTKDGGVCQKVSVALTGLSDTAFRASNVEAALTGKKLTKENIAAAAQAAGEGVMAMGDHFASEEYRLHLAKVFAKRALMAAAE
ncbi:MAG: xanthine dehydrogenase family protein subunit M [Lewinellaceae bacterium]|nr:xanthine dehydrogenase family protein subunit M [Phaeodactylibacter sp.]MCB0614106.1 xanthine dehydrogenase family protein subunit M [Phaeodactylibacter sp.]MCB9347698.1 xanthine dehydrogenase family protein subunit M [Lewinellaceae bacterium]